MVYGLLHHLVVLLENVLELFLLLLQSCLILFCQHLIPLIRILKLGQFPLQMFLLLLRPLSLSPPEFARDMEARCNAVGVQYIDAPISGGSVKAAAGQLSIMASGAPAAFEAAAPVLEACAETVFRLGDAAGAGSAMKAVNQLLAGVHIAAMAEAMTFGMTQGISPEDFVRVIPQCAGTSWMLENRAPHIVEGDYTPHSAVDIWPKDLGIVLDIARGAKFGAPLTAAALQQFVAASGSGHGREDDAAVAKVYARNAGLSLPGEG